MKKPQLFLLKPGYGKAADQFCPDCALVMGYFDYQPHMREHVDIKLIDFDRPRHDLVKLLGEHLQNSPALIFSEGEQPQDISLSENTKRAYINDGRAICQWLGQTYGGLVPS